MVMVGMAAGAWPSNASRVSGAIAVLVGSEVSCLLLVAGYTRMNAKQKVAGRPHCEHCLLFVGELR